MSIEWGKPEFIQDMDRASTGVWDVPLLEKGQS